MGNERVAFLPLSPSVFFTPESLKISELQPALKTRQIPTAGLQKKAMVAHLNKWMTNAQRESKLDCSKLSTLPLNTPVLDPVAICVCGSDLLFISELT